MQTALQNADSAHDLAHVQRVVATAVQLATVEHADLQVVVPAAWLHDCVILPKNHPDRVLASRRAAEKAGAFLHTAGYPAVSIPAIQHAIAAHSFSAGIPPETIEAQVVQDADRLDAIGAIGIVRCVLTGDSFDAVLYEPQDPFAITRPCDDKKYMVDHFFVKLFKLQETMQTTSGREEAQRRTAFMHDFLRQLGHELKEPYPER